jgi:TolB-like protein
LRRELGEDSIHSVGDELVLNTERVPSDVARFNKALANDDIEGATNAYGGPFLDGWYIDDAPEFERWAEDERQRLQRLFIKALEHSAVTLEGKGDTTAAIARWREIVRVDAHSGKATLHLATLLAKSGERGAALKALQSHAEAMRRDLDLEPGRELETLAQDLRKQAVDEKQSPVLYVLPARMPDFEQDVPTQPTEVNSKGNALQRLTRLTQFRLAAAGVVGTIAVLALTLMVKPKAVDATPESDHRVAVLYLDHAGGGSNDLRFVAEDLSNEIINQLSLNAFTLVPAAEAKAVRDGRVSLDSLIQNGRVQSLVEGTLRRTADRFEATIRLTDVGTGRHIATGTFAKPAADIYGLEQDLTRFVASALSQHLRRSVVVREVDRGTRDPLARKLVQLADRRREDAAVMIAQGHALDREPAMRALIEAESLLVRAQRVDPAWSRPFADLAFVSRDRARLLSGDERASLLTRGLSHVTEALRRTPRDAAALEARGWLEWTAAMSLLGAGRDTSRLKDADSALREAVEIEPNRSSAWLALSYVQSVRGQAAAARISATRALEGNAFLANAEDVYFGLFASALTSDSMVAASRWCLQGRRVYPADARFLECELTLLRERGSSQADTALAWRLVSSLDSMDRESARESRTTYAPTYRRVVAAAVSAHAGDTARARAELRQARRAVAGQPSLQLDLAFDEAYVRLALGEPGVAVQLLRSVIAARPLLERVVARAPLFRAVRDSFTESTASRTKE